MEVKIRFNTDHHAITNPKKWRLIIDGQEKLVDEINILGKCHTTSDDMEKVGLKHHISCVAKTIVYKNDVVERIINGFPYRAEIAEINTL